MYDGLIPEGLHTCYIWVPSSDKKSLCSFYFFVLFLFVLFCVRFRVSLFLLFCARLFVSLSSVCVDVGIAMFVLPMRACKCGWIQLRAQRYGAASRLCWQFIQRTNEQDSAWHRQEKMHASNWLSVHCTYAPLFSFLLNAFASFFYCCFWRSFWPFWRVCCWWPSRRPSLRPPYPSLGIYRYWSRIERDKGSRIERDTGSRIERDKGGSR